MSYYLRPETIDDDDDDHLPVRVTTITRDQIDSVRAATRCACRFVRFVPAPPEDPDLDW